MVNNGTITVNAGGNFIYGGGNAGFVFQNAGLVSSVIGTLSVGDRGNDVVTNQPGGTFEANGGTLTFDSSGASVSNVASSTITGGTWIAAAGGTINFLRHDEPDRDE